ncbi:hypothetical protein AB0D45_34780 [Streptomyces sp. NPDC048352]|uniref:hypothetical protein n=1 Tax=Streptomyces sp. NPDC048352 TaxID=3154718 RepID=UPI0034401D6E
MLERTPHRDRDQTAFVLPGTAPAGQTGAPPSAGSRGVRYLAAGDYWFNDHAAAALDGPWQAPRTDDRAR